MKDECKLNYEFLSSDTALKIYIALVSVIITQAINIIIQGRKSKKEVMRLKYESFYQEVIHDIYNLFKTMNAFRTDSLIGNPYEQKDTLLVFIEDNKKILERKSFQAYQELKEARFFEDGLGHYQEILEVKLFAEILDDYIKLYKPKDYHYKVFCFIQIWRITLMINSANYLGGGQVLKYVYGSLKVSHNSN